MTVVEQLAATLVRAGVTRVWGMPGGDTLPLMDALAAVGLPFHLVRHETSAAFAADASAQLTGAPGACVATLGPGMTNLVTGVAGCLLDRAPVLALTSRYRADRRPTYTHMMLDQGLVARSCGKGHLVLPADGAARALDRALATATAPRPGPVWIEIPVDVASKPTEAHPPQTTPRAAPATLDAALVAQVTAWKRPAILVGFGGRHADVAGLAAAMRAPAWTTYKAKGAIPEGTGWSAGAAGLSPVIDRHHLAQLQQCDGVLLLGWDPVELRDHWMPGWPERAAVVCLDDHVPVDIPARIDALHVGDLTAAAADLAARANGGASTWTRTQVAAHRAAWQAELAESTPGPATAIRAVQAAVPSHAVVTLDTGAHRITASNVWLAAAPDRLLQSNGLASMGYALPAALAAAAEGHPAVCITGDAGLQMVLGELGVAREHQLDLVVVVIDDSSLALIELKQRRRGGSHDGLRFVNPDWILLAAAFGAHATVAATPERIQRAVREGLEAGGVHLVAVPVDSAAYLDQM